MLFTILLIVLGVSLVLFFFGHRLEKGEVYEPEKAAKKFFFTYAVIVCLLLSWLIANFIGFKKHGSPGIPLEKLGRINHLGYYIQHEGELILAGETMEEGFIHKPLLKDEQITLKPKWTRKVKESTADKWEIRYNTRSLPLRLNDHCVNLPGDCWFNSNDSLVITYQKENYRCYISIRWLDETTTLGVHTNSYFFNHGTFTITDEQSRPKLNPRFPDDGILLTEGMFKEGLSLYSLIKLCGEQDLLTIRIPDWWEIADKIKIIRKEKGNLESPMGVLVPDELFTKQKYARHFNFYILSSNFCRTLKRIEEGFRSIAFDTKISYGFGQKDTLSLSLTKKRVENTIFGDIVEIKLAPPPSWPLPPGFDKGKHFIITSSIEYIGLDGYMINRGNTLHPFYAKASFKTENDSLSIVVNEGRSRREYRPGETIRLGDLENGVLLSLTKNQTPVPYAGWFSIAFILILTALFCYLLISDRITRLRLDLAWTLVWGLVLTILTARLILSYRVSLLPPEDASPLELANVFHKSFKISFWALLLVPLLLLLVRFISIHWDSITSKLKGFNISSWGPKWKEEWKNWTLLFLLYMGAFAAATALANSLGQSGAYWGLANTIIHIAIIFGLAFFARGILDSESKGYFAVFVLFLVLAPTIVSFVLGNNGLFIYLISFLICILITGLSSTYRIKKIVPGIIGIIFITAFLGIAPHIFNPSCLQKAVHLSVPDKVFYRLGSSKGTEDKILLSQSDKYDTNMNVLLRNTRQNWQMLHYAARGMADPRGYGQSPLSDKGMTYPTAMSECMYSQLFLPEHGRWAGIILILIYILLGSAILYGACSFPTGYKHRLIPLTAIAAFFIFNTLYMACANLGLVFFTGQNIPLLGLYSISDLVQSALLLMLVAFLISQGLSTSSSIRTPAVSVSLLVFVILTGLVVFPGLFFRMNHMAASDSPYRQAHGFGDELYQTIENNLPGTNDIPDEAKPLELDNEYLINRPNGQIIPIEKIFKDQFNNRIDKFNPDGGLYYLERNGESSAHRSEISIKINRNFFDMSSPFREDKLWPGKILASQEESAPALLALDYPFTISLKESGHARTVYLGKRNGQRNLNTNRQVLIKSEELNMVFFELIREENKLSLIPKHDPRWFIYVNGRKIKTELNEVVALEPFTLIVVQWQNGNKRIRYNLIYLGFLSPVMAYTQWRNGKDLRFFPEGDIFPMAYALGKAGDGIVKQQAEIPGDLSLSINYSLHAALQKILNDYHQENPFYREKDNISETKILAAAVLDTFSGEILALPSWPSFNPEDTDFEKMLTKLLPQEQHNILKNNNLKNHLVGAAVKPLFFSALAAQSRDYINPAELIVFHKKESGIEITGKMCPHSYLGNIRIKRWDCEQPGYSRSNARDFLIDARNYTDVLMCMLGMLLEGEDWDKILIPAYSSPDLEYRGRTYNIDLREVEKSPFSLNDELPAPRTTIMNATFLFKGLKELFELGLSEETQALLLRNARVFLPSFFAGGTKKEGQETEPMGQQYLEKNKFLQDVVPEIVNFRPKDFQTIYGELIPFFLGKGNCRWNNLHLVEAFSRIVSGLRVKARFEKVPVTTGHLAEMPAPFDKNSYWKNTNIIDSLEKAGEIGNARMLKGMAASPYRIIFRTGAVEEENNERESEMLFFAIGKWENRINGFIPGQTVSCFFYMQDSKLKESRMEKKFDFARPIIAEIMNYLKAR